MARHDDDRPVTQQYTGDLAAVLPPLYRRTAGGTLHIWRCSMLRRADADPDVVAVDPAGALPAGAHRLCGHCVTPALRLLAARPDTPIKYTPPPGERAPDPPVVADGGATAATSSSGPAAAPDAPERGVVPLTAVPETVVVPTNARANTTTAHGPPRGEPEACRPRCGRAANGWRRVEWAAVAPTYGLCGHCFFSELAADPPVPDRPDPVPPSEQ